MYATTTLVYIVHLHNIMTHDTFHENRDQPPLESCTDALSHMKNYPNQTITNAMKQSSRGPAAWINHKIVAIPVKLFKHWYHALGTAIRWLIASKNSLYLEGDSLLCLRGRWAVWALWVGQYSQRYLTKRRWTNHVTDIGDLAELLW